MESLNSDNLDRISEFLSYTDFVAFIKTCKRINELKNNLTKKIEYFKELYELCCEKWAFGCRDMAP